MTVLPEEYIGSDYKTVEEEMKSYGFTNIIIESKDTTDSSNVGKIVEFSIGGKSYNRGDIFKKTEEVKIVYWKLKEENNSSVYYSTNDSKAVKNGNSGIYSYINKGGYYYYIIDFNDKSVYSFSEGDGSETAKKARIVSGDLNSTLIVKYVDGSSKWQEGLHFKYKNQPNHLVLEDDDHFEYDFYPTSLSEAQTILKRKKIF